MKLTLGDMVAIGWVAAVVITSVTIAVILETNRKTRTS